MAHEAAIRELYEAFGRRDGDAMAALYHPEATFRDPVFSLEGAEIGKMWRMLCRSGGDLRVTYDAVAADGDHGSATWEARYSFGSRPVHNRITSTFRFADGLIVDQVDEFDFPAWASQALGPIGRLLGRTGWLHRKVRRDAAARLARSRG